MERPDEDGVYYVSNWKCFALLSSPLAQAMISIDCIEIVILFLIAVRWLLSRRKIQLEFRVARWHNFGLTIAFWLFYAYFRFVVFLVLWCPFVDRVAVDFRLQIAEVVFHWIFVSLLLTAVLLPISRGLDSLRNSPSLWWRRTAKVAMALFVVFVTIYLAIMIWEVETMVKLDDNSVFDEAFERFSLVGVYKDLSHPRYVKISKGVETTWLILSLVGIAKMLTALRGASSNALVPTALKGWTYVLALSIFAYGVTRMFMVFWDSDEINFLFYNQDYLTKYVPVLVLPVLFYLLALLSVLQVATKLGMLLANQNFYEAKPKPGKTAANLEGGVQNVEA